MERGLQLIHKDRAPQTLNLLESKLVTPTALGLGRTTSVSCENPALDAHVTDAARQSLGMAPKLGAKTGVVDGPPPAVFEDVESGAIRVVHREMRVRFGPDVTAALRSALLERFSLERRSGSRDDDARHTWTVKSKNRDHHGAELLHLANRLSACDEVIWATPHFVSSYERQMPIFPQVPPDGWHLNQIRAPLAWTLSLGLRTVVAVVDDGVDVDHHNLKTRMKLRPDPTDARDRFGRDFVLDDTDPDHFNPRPKAFRLPPHLMAGNDLHGTACAGLIAAEGSFIAGPNPAVGVAPKARLLAVKVFQGSRFIPDAKVAAGLRYAGAFADVLSCSWTSARNVEVDDAITEAATVGRNGRGCCVVVATGNHSAATIAYPASHPMTIAVGAIAEDGSETGYANKGDGLDCCAPSSGGPRSIYTTDWSADNRGLNIAPGIAGGHTVEFEGTSAACPQVSGTIALMLSRKPSLSLDAVRSILRSTAARVGFGAVDDGEPHLAFGYGRIDAFAAVHAALQF